MKKMFFIALCGISIVSCKKEALVKPTTAKNTTMESQVADLIKKADPTLYDQMYDQTSNQKAPINGVKTLPGIFYIPSSGLNNATCWPAYNVCMVIVSATKAMGSGNIEMITNNMSETYPDGVTTKLIINSPNPESKIIKFFSAEKGANGEFNINYKQ